MTSPLTTLAPTAELLLLLVSPARAELDPPTRDALRDSYCGLVSDAVAAGFHRQERRILADTAVEQETLNNIRGKAWQAAHREWQNRGLGGFRGWCRNEGKAATGRFLSEPH